MEKPLKFDALITTFEMILADEELKKINFRMCIIDEAHRLKNRNCKLLTDGFSAFKMVKDYSSRCRYHIYRSIEYC